MDVVVPKKQVHLVRRGFLDGYQHWQGEQTSAMEKQGRKLTHPKSKQERLFRNQSSCKALSDRIWRDGLQEILVESGLATWAEGDCNDLRNTDIASGKNLTWYTFRQTWITFALERGVPCRQFDLFPRHQA